MGSHRIGSVEDWLHGGTLRKWSRQAERDTGCRNGMTTSDHERLKELERENRELIHPGRFSRPEPRTPVGGSENWRARQPPSYHSRNYMIVNYFSLGRVKVTRIVTHVLYASTRPLDDITCYLWARKHALPSARRGNGTEREISCRQAIGEYPEFYLVRSNLPKRSSSERAVFTNARDCHNGHPRVVRFVVVTLADWEKTKTVQLCRTPWYQAASRCR